MSLTCPECGGAGLPPTGRSRAGDPLWSVDDKGACVDCGVRLRVVELDDDYPGEQDEDEDECLVTVSFATDEDE